MEAKDLRLRGVISIETGQAVGVGLFVFTATAIGRAVAPSAEGRLEWVPAQRLPELDAVEDLPALLPRVLAMPPEAPCFSAHYHYEADGQLVMEFDEADQ